MTIKQSIQEINGMTFNHIVKSRVLKFSTHDAWDVQITNQQHFTMLEQKVIYEGSHVLTIWLQQECRQYHGVVELLSNGTRIERNWEKVNSERNSKLNVEKIRDVLDAVLEFYHSPEGKMLSITQTLESVRVEMEAAQARANELLDYSHTLLQEGDAWREVLSGR